MNTMIVIFGTLLAEWAAIAVMKWLGWVTVEVHWAKRK